MRLGSTPESSDGIFLSVAKAAKLCDCSTAGFRQMIRRGKVAGVLRWGRRGIRIDRAKLVTWLRSQAVRTRASKGAR